MKKPKVAIVLGTRPEIIKMSPVIRRLHREGWPYFLIHTGQHYSYHMDQLFFEQLEIPRRQLEGKDYVFTRPPAIGANRHEELVESMTRWVRSTLERERPDAVLVQGDTDTVLAGARAAAAAGGIVIGHVEAGLRSGDLEMPEERNRIEADRLSHVLFAPTQAARENLIREGLGHKKIEVTGNTIVDALRENLEIASKSGDPLLPRTKYALVTLHRPESVDNRPRLESVLRALVRLVEEGLVDKVVFPVHPRTRMRMAEHGVPISYLEYGKIEACEPSGFLEFIWLEKHAHLILTDSGGVQEEACVLGVPCVTLRTSTERPETVEVGANVVAGYDEQQIVEYANLMIKKKREWENPFGDGRASERILSVLPEISLSPGSVR